jgi:hypothetical protein
MPTLITISSLTGSSPYDVWICNSASTGCIYVSTISSAPYSFEVPFIYSELEELVLKIIDNNNCIKTDTINV